MGFVVLTLLGGAGILISQVSALHLERSGSDRVVAGVCGGLAARLGVDATLVRLFFALLALAGGAGILLYFALWVYGDGRRRTWAAATLGAAAAAMLFLALGLSSAVIGATLLVAGFAIVAVRGGSLRPGGSLPILGVLADRHQACRGAGADRGGKRTLLTDRRPVIGDCHTHGAADAEGDIEVGYGLAAPYRGLGYGTELVEAFSQWLLAPGIRRVVARHVPTANVASRRVLERAGFVLERADEQHTWYALSQPG